jgi:biopolymer transport protein ExbD
MSGSAGTTGRAPFALAVVRPRRRAMLSLAPLIDVTFLLLVFFMLVTQFDRLAAIDVSVSHSPPVELSSEQAGGGARPGTVRLAVRADGALELDGRRLGGTPVLPAALEQAAARAAGEAGDKPPLLLVEPDGDLPLQRLVAVLVALERQPWFNVRLVHRKAAEGSSP